MDFMLTSKALDALNIEELFNHYKGGYFHVAPAIPRVAVINLGMKKEELIDIINMKCCVNVFDEEFHLNQLKSVPSDAIFISNGKIETTKLQNVIDKMKTIIGKKTILGAGLGKDLLGLAIQQMGDSQPWQQEGSILKNEKYHVYACDSGDGPQLQQLFEYI